MDTALVLFRRDLRLTDNPAWSAACTQHARVLPVFIHADDDAGSTGAASRWWLHHSLLALDHDLRDAGAALHLRRGEPLGTLRADGVAMHSHNAALWCEPWQIATQQGQPYKVFTPYWRNLRAQLQATGPLPAPRVPGWRDLSGSLPLAALELLPRIAWADGLAASWQPGEAGAQELLEIFADDAIGDYAHARDLPARHGTSRLSPHLHFGEISPRQIHFELDRRARAIDARRR